MRPAAALAALAEEELQILLDGRLTEDPGVLERLAGRRDALMAELHVAPLTEEDRAELRRAAELQAAVTRALDDARRAVASELRGAHDGRQAAAAYGRA